MTEPRSRLVDGATFILDAPERIPAVWGDHPEVGWAQGEALLLVGPPGTGKTTLGGQLLRARLGLADSLLGWTVTATRRRVLYLACDRPPQIARAMRRIFTEDDRAVLAERLVVWRGPPTADLARQPDALVNMAAAAGVDTVFVDSLKDVTAKLSDDEIGAGLNHAVQATLVAGVEIVALHHQTKRGNGGKPDTLADVYGSAWITAGAGSVILLWGNAGDPVVELKHLKSPGEEIGPLHLLHDHHTGTTSIYRETDLFDLIRANAAHGLTAHAAACALFDSGEPTKSQVEKARRKLDRLVREGLVFRKDGARGGASRGDPGTPSRYFLAVLHGVS